MRCTGCRPDNISRRGRDTREKAARANILVAVRDYTRVVRHEIIGIAVDYLYSVHTRGARLRLPKKASRVSETYLSRREIRFSLA